MNEVLDNELHERLANSPGGAGIDWSSSIKYAPELLAAYEEMAAVPLESNILDPKVKELVLIAVNVSATNLREDALRWHIRNALKHGATGEEITEVYELTSTLGVHSLTVGVPILLDMVGTDGEPPALPAMDSRRAALKEEFIANRGYWSDFWEAVVRLAPEYFQAYAAFSSVPWNHGVLSPKVKEFIYIAIAASATHMFEPSIRVHTKNALGYGATPSEIMEVFELVSLLGIHTMTFGMPILEEELKAAGKLT